MAKKEKGALVQKETMQPVSLFEDMDRYMEQFFRNPFSMLSSPLMTGGLTRMEGITPSVDIYDDGDDMVLKAEIPGIKKDDLDVTITDEAITISGEKKQEEKVDKENYHRIERRYGSFSRSFRLPDNVNAGKAKAEFKDGVLEVRIPKTKESKKKKIEIK
ncbi:Hsp20/alpha crystallin family protein [Thermodesulfobacteriota bacterium B35]